MKLKIIFSIISSVLVMSSFMPPAFASENGAISNSTPTLFCGDAEDKRVYNYCPSAVYYDNSIYVYFCSNPTEGVVRDSIYLSKVNCNTLTCTEKRLMLSPSETGWDKMHVCDPSVISGNFTYNGSNYNYLMAYLGCDRQDVQHNQIGIAVAESLDGEWTKVEEVNPIISSEFDSSLGINQWGVGQPSAVNIDKSGTVAIFYTGNKTGHTCTNCEIFDLSDLNAPRKITEFVVSNTGTENESGKPETITNAEFAYSSGTGKMYMITDRHPFTKYPTIIADKTDIYETDIGDISNVSYLSDCVWTKSDTINAEKTGSEKNHNAAFLRTASGNLYTNAALYTSADESLWSYRIGITRFNADGYPSVDIYQSAFKNEENEIIETAGTELIPPETDVNIRQEENESDNVMNTGVDDYMPTIVFIGVFCIAVAAISVVSIRKERL